MTMTVIEKTAYEDADALRAVIENLKGRKFKLDCGHHVTFGHPLGNNVTIYNGKTQEIICSQCGY